MPMQAIELEARPFHELSPFDLYHLLSARQQVFVVEQGCPYPDCDGKDLTSLHLLARASGTIVGGCRLVRAGISYDEPSIGRVFTSKDYRGTGLGKQLIARAVEIIRENDPDQSIRISAQQYLEKFYTGFGFQTVSGAYLEDGIPHIEMLLMPSTLPLTPKSLP